jgi:hypothetical protein
LDKPAQSGLTWELEWFPGFIATHQEENLKRLKTGSIACSRVSPPRSAEFRLKQSG